MFRTLSASSIVDIKPTKNVSPGQLSDALIEACRQGNNIAFRHLYQQFKVKVASTVRYLLGPSPDIEDVIQAVFLEVFRSIKNYKGDSKLSTWIYRVTVNVTLQQIRKNKRQRKYLVQNNTDESEWPSSRVLNVNPIGRYEDREILKRVYGMLDGINLKKRTVFVLHELEQIPVQDIALIVGTSVNTVKSRLFHARRELMERMKRRGMI